MRYYLGGIPDQTFVDYARDLNRALEPFKRSLRVTPLTDLKFYWKYLGENFQPIILEELEAQLKLKFAELHVSEFTYPLSPVIFGSKWEYRPDVIFARLEPSEELNAFYRLLHELAIERQDLSIVRRKDPNHLVGNIKMAALKGNISQADLKALEETVKAYQRPPAIKISSVVFIGTEIYRGQVQSTILKTIPLYKAVE